MIRRGDLDLRALHAPQLFQQMGDFVVDVLGLANHQTHVAWVVAESRCAPVVAVGSVVLPIQRRSVLELGVNSVRCKSQ